MPHNQSIDHLSLSPPLSLDLVSCKRDTRMRGLMAPSTTTLHGLLTTITLFPLPPPPNCHEKVIFSWSKEEGKWIPNIYSMHRAFSLSPLGRRPTLSPEIKAIDTRFCVCSDKNEEVCKFRISTLWKTWPMYRSRSTRSFFNFFFSIGELNLILHSTHPLTMHEMGWPTYWVAVIMRLQVSSRTVVKTLCNRKTALSVWISWCLK